MNEMKNKESNNLKQYQQS